VRIPSIFFFFVLVIVVLILICVLYCDHTILIALFQSFSKPNTTRTVSFFRNKFR